jgi:hypothetical protein
MYPEVELYLNGKSHGRKQTTRETEWKAKYVIQYEPGALTQLENFALKLRPSGKNVKF